MLFFSWIRYAAEPNASWLYLGIMNGIIFLVCLIYFLIIRVRIPFSIEIIRAVATVIQLYPGTQVVAFFSTILHFAWTCFYIFAFYTILANVSDTRILYASLIYLLFSFYWVSEVIKNVLHVTVSGVLATWYFLSGSNVGMPASPTLGALKRSLTTSFGSICLGSLIVAIIKTIRAILSIIRGKNDNIVACLVDCCLRCLENIVKYFNHFAFCQVAIYGKTFIEAAKSTWNLLLSSGIEAIVNDNIVSGVLTMGCVFVAILAGAGGVGLCFLLIDIANTWFLTLAIIFGIFGIVVGFLIANLTSMVMDSGVTCTFVCFAEDREILRNNNPELFQKLMETYHLWG